MRGGKVKAIGDGGCHVENAKQTDLNRTWNLFIVCPTNNTQLNLQNGWMLHPRIKDCFALIYIVSTLSWLCPLFSLCLFSTKPGNRNLANSHSSTETVFCPFVNWIVQDYTAAKQADYKYGATCDITAVNISEGGRWAQLSLSLRGERSCCAVWRRSCTNRLNGPCVGLLFS